jgi:signal transduction histidine kinase
VPTQFPAMAAGKDPIHPHGRNRVTPLNWVVVPFRSIEDPAKLRRVLEATLLLEADLELRVLLHHFIEEAQSMTGARYGALGVLNDDHTALSEFLTVGLEPDEEERIGARPTGQGVLGVLITDPRPLRASHIASHEESFGFPPNHPPMTSFLGVPIKVRGEVYGNLYLTDKVGWSEFTRDDEALVEALALAAGIAIENARLHQRMQAVAVYEDRDRVARDLHDTVIQRLFAVTLSLQSMTNAAEATGMADRLKEAVSNLDATIRQVRSTIYELGSGDIVQGVRATVLALVRELNSVVGVEVRTSIDGPVDAAISDEVAEHLLATVREALTNVGRHAQASEVSVSLSVKGDSCILQVRDNGQGVDETKTGEGGLGLGNLRRRAEKLHGQLVIERLDTGGTLLTWQVPISP